MSAEIFVSGFPGLKKVVLENFDCLLAYVCMFVVKRLNNPRIRFWPNLHQICSFSQHKYGHEKSFWMILKINPILVKKPSKNVVYNFYKNNFDDIINVKIVFGVISTLYTTRTPKTRPLNVLYEKHIWNSDSNFGKIHTKRIFWITFIIYKINNFEKFCNNWCCNAAFERKVMFLTPFLSNPAQPQPLDRLKPTLFWKF